MSGNPDCRLPYGFDRCAPGFIDLSDPSDRACAFFIAFFIYCRYGKCGIVDTAIPDFSERIEL